MATNSYGKRTPCMHRSIKPCNSFSMVNLASGVNRGYVCPNMTAVLQLVEKTKGPSLDKRFNEQSSGCTPVL